jgi:hypothetical protein
VGSEQSQERLLEEDDEKGKREEEEEEEGEKAQNILEKLVCALLQFF